MQKQKHLQQRPTTASPAPPTLNVSSSSHSDSFRHGDSDTSLFEKSSKQTTTTIKDSIIDASQTILFTTTSLKRTVGRCISYTDNDNLQATFTPILTKAKAATERLGQILDLIEDDKETVHNLIQSTAQCISALKELCYILTTRLSIIVQGLDSKFSRHLLIHLYSATVDIKEAWQIISPYLTIDPLSIVSNKASSFRNRSDSEAHSPFVSPLCSPYRDNKQLYTCLKNAVTGSFHVLNTLQQSIEETLNSSVIPSLERKLKELLRQAQYVTDLAHKLDKSIDSRINKDEYFVNKQQNRKFWEDTSIYLKAMVSLMTLIRSISKEEDFVWPRTVKQGCLYVTRITAEVAKLWNNSSTFAQDGFFLGKTERSTSISEQDIPMPRRNT
ncbi:hypothetical protein CU097_015308 [Rhizopus azygosporus]|uniref:Uncharacterized protein n=2 Tax=Rhizopus TaxID=4842 RepID=A0A367KCX4_RHIAZ|nr:hypothetical protein BCV71DRAFT_202672 [Rhizopus microsporus]RCI00056.1 hypothetical protein CU097_015308 [Rhizopus azygosporus]